VSWVVEAGGERANLRLSWGFPSPAHIAGRGIFFPKPVRKDNNCGASEGWELRRPLPLYSTPAPRATSPRPTKMPGRHRPGALIEMRPSNRLLCFACVIVLFPQSAAGESVFAVESEVSVRADSFACKETSELDRLLQRNRSGGFTSGTQLYDYLKAHKCVGLTAGRARVYSTRGQYVCIYDAKDNKTNIYPCAWTRTDMLSK
jgi:hypothetical protein